MAAIGAHGHELRIPDRDHARRVGYAVAEDAIVILEVYSKKTQSTPSQVIAVCRKRLAAFVKAAANWEQE